MEHTDLEERDWLYALAQIDGVGRKTLRLIYEELGSFSQFPRRWNEPWANALRLSRSVRQQIERRLSESRVRAAKAERLRAGFSFFCFLDESFPALVAEIPDAPLVLFARGNPAWLDKPAIAVVGTRKPSPYGRAVCQQLTSELAQAGMVIVSGLAHGIDAEAHRAALQAGAGSIAVLGCGIDQVYPARHRALYREIAEAGLLLSEYPPGTPPRSGLFPERNRIISGLSLGVVVVEAAERSGSLITADCALEQGREVFAVPGPIFSAGSAGPHNLIKQGAKLVTGGRDVLEEFPRFMPVREWTQQPAAPALEASQRRLLALLEYTPLHWDELYVRLDAADRPGLDRDLLRLVTKGLAACLPGGYYVKLRDQV